MPKRSNFFQRLIVMIEEAMVDVPGSTVQESVLLEDRRTGEEREVDILIDALISGYPLRVAIECRNYRRRCDSTWIDQLIGKYEDLPVDKVIAVSRRGFYRPAAEKAEQHGITTLSLREATSADWADILTAPADERGWHHYATYWRAVAFHLSDPEARLKDSALHDEAESKDYWVTDHESGYSWHLPDFERMLTQNQELRESISQAAGHMIGELSRDRTHHSASRSGMMSTGVDYSLSDTSGNLWAVDRVSVQFEVRVERSRTAEFEYRGQRVSVSSFKREGDILDDPSGWVTVHPRNTDKGGLIAVSRPVVNGEFRPLHIALGMERISSDDA